MDSTNQYLVRRPFSVTVKSVQKKNLTMYEYSNVSLGETEMYILLRWSIIIYNSKLSQICKEIQRLKDIR